MGGSNSDPIRGVITRINRAWRERIFIGLEECFSPEAVMVGPGYKVLGRGREFFVDSYREFAQTANVSQYSEGELMLEVFDPIAICAYRWTMTYDRDGVSSTERGTDQFVLSRAGLHWQVVMRYINFERSDECAP